MAHKVVFGNGYLTWEWDQGLRCQILIHINITRGSSGPLSYLFSTPCHFYCSSFCIWTSSGWSSFCQGGISRVWVELTSPMCRLMTGALTAFGDLALLKLARRREDPSTVSWLLLLTQVWKFLPTSCQPLLTLAHSCSLLYLLTFSHSCSLLRPTGSSSTLARAPSPPAWRPRSFSSLSPPILNLAPLVSQLSV